MKDESKIISAVQVLRDRFIHEGNVLEGVRLTAKVQALAWVIDDEATDDALLEIIQNGPVTEKEKP